MDKSEQGSADRGGSAVAKWPVYVSGVGLGLAVIGLLSYFLYFYQFPALRDFPLLNLPVILIGLLLALAGCWGSFQKRGSLPAKLFVSSALVATLGTAGLFGFYIFSLSYRMPVAEAAPKELAVAPDFTLKDQNGREVRLSEFLGQKLILVFYRGHW